MTCIRCGERFERTTYPFGKGLCIRCARFACRASPFAVHVWTGNEWIGETRACRYCRVTLKDLVA